MRKVFSILFICLCSCTSIPKNFTYHYDEADTGLADKINIEGYYVVQHGSDSTFYSMFMFYPDGLFTIATTSEISQELIDCFRKGGESTVCKYPLWGLYKLNGDTIKTQTLRTEGGGCVIYRDYLLVSTSELVNISDYVQPEYTKMGYMKNYPSFQGIDLEIRTQFFPSTHKRDRSDCPFIDKKWFRK